uniref:Uncharacterized protein n=2 Tax=Vibrio cyclitrophicus TaxID=47951 RepID=A0A7Z1MIN5_9VIBR|nr:RHS repeat-associated core domain-containing protein [Vibrio cyclitrophicus]PMP18960.1 hypothetical protein BCS91_24160 [Vibrio cyclitrophicus]PMP29113.1 hypothetical protein BCS90_19155 [Vibrio cyclitrophicus]
MANRGITRRSFVKSICILAAAAPVTMHFGVRASQVGNGVNSIIARTHGFHGMRKDPVVNLYHAGNGERVYAPRLMRFNSLDSAAFSPFGKGGIHSYAFVSNNPANQRDPSGNFAVMSILIGAIVGATSGSAISAISEGARAAVNGDSFDWRRVGIGAAIGMISGGFGSAAAGTEGAVKLGLLVADSVVSGALEVGLTSTVGDDARSAAYSAMIGAVIGAAGFGVGSMASDIGDTITGARKGLAKVMKVGLSGRGAQNAAGQMAHQSNRAPLERAIYQLPISEAVGRHLDLQSLSSLNQVSRTINESMTRVRNNRMKVRWKLLDERMSALEHIYDEQQRTISNRARLARRQMPILRDYSAYEREKEQLVSAWLRSNPSDFSIIQRVRYSRFMPFTGGD